MFIPGSAEVNWTPPSNTGATRSNCKTAEPRGAKTCTNSAKILLFKTVQRCYKTAKAAARFGGCPRGLEQQVWMELQDTAVLDFKRAQYCK